MGFVRSRAPLTTMPAQLDRRRCLIAAAALLTVASPDMASAQAVPDPPAAKPPVSIEVAARPIPFFDTHDHSHLRFGSLQYRSGLVLTSTFRGFGGLSGLRLDAKGERLTAISDKGMWFTGRIIYRGDAMIGLADVEAAPMLGAEGRPLAARGWFDTESITRDGPLVYVGIERVNQIVRFDFGKDGTRARGEVVATPAAVRKLPYNKGLESLVMVPKGLPLAGTLIAISERGLDCRRQPCSVSDRRPDTGAVQHPPQQGFRYQRRGVVAVGRSLDPGAQVRAAVGHGGADPADVPEIGGTGGDRRWPIDLRCRPGL
jgi:hypothetical protein